MAPLVSSSLMSPVRLCCLHRSLCWRSTRTLSAAGLAQRSLLCPSQGAAALCRQTNSPWWNGSRGFSSRGDGAAVEQQTLQDIAKSIREQQYKRVVVMAGAGISTPSGIPDFRSPGSGLYDNLQQYDLPYAEAIFEINFFHQNPNPFFALAKELYPGNYQPNLTHYFVQLLHKKGQLLRMYTQNIDGLERLAGIPPAMLVEAHGTFATATCTVCLKRYEGDELRPDVMSGTVPKCSTCKGVVKPDIVFFGEELPVHFFKYLTDFPLADLLIVMGTSLEVEPFASLAGAVRSSVPRLLINRDLVGPFAWSRRPNDVVQLGDVVSGVQALVDALGWTQELDALMAAQKRTTKTEE
ncbi:NAD-dependent protein deacetylase sirtuin-3, mitochondrial isoform X1 [Micropterus dolomieu]|uniref:NAD-dependent protein deacetylase sirtuin-3, mitochondrial isoform X1 n=1 Tax=Micropterus dolomieu TaxID=147949 RepID=UPI001E8E53ED|nr:NAD-dependent protein deacetylase sirtuin-3, mitochondrial isoform X1 [Micropterus dolomieu]XP_045888079.1 NAD-dependent protein deacetylase sirtuin-3, mitochondrial isoform X1 [Micropterus dolomieu]